MQSHSSYFVPQYVEIHDGKVVPSHDLKLKSDYSLSSVQLIDKHGRVIIAAYCQTLGYISIQNTTRDHHHFSEDFSRTFRIIYQCNKTINNIIVSDDQHLIAIQLQNEKQLMVSSC